MTSDPTQWPLWQAADALRRRALSARELTTLCLAKARREQARLNAFIHLDEDLALRAADRADAAFSAGEPVGPLHGIPVAYKDMFYRAGVVCTCGSKIRRDFVPDVTATVLRRLDAAGAISLGGLNMSEFAVGPMGHNLPWGNCRNAWNPDHIPAGSSSGSGTALGARLVFGALGSDTGGSVRLPAAANGVFGLKPTAGRVSRHGAMGLSFTLDTIGPLARSARDCARLLGVIAGGDPHDPTASPRPVDDYEAGLGGDLAGWRIGISARPQRLDTEVAQAHAAAHAVLEDLGAILVEIDIPDDSELADLSNIILGVEAATLHLPWIRSRPEDYNPQVLGRLQPGLAYPGTAYLRALQLRPRILDEYMAAVFGGCDLLFWPVVPTPVPTLAETDVGAGRAMPEAIARITQFTRPLNYLGLPGLSVPAGFCAKGLPIAFQLIGPPFAEGKLLQAGDAYERATDWSQRSPDG